MKGAFLLLLCTLLHGCSGEFKPLEFSAGDEIKPGPGLFTGEQGEFVLYQGDPLGRKPQKTSPCQKKEVSESEDSSQS